MRNLLLNILILFVLILNSCKKETVTETKDINAIIVNTPYLPEPPIAAAPTPVSTKDVNIVDNDINYLCSETTYSYANNMEKVIAFNPNSGTLYPGSLVQGKHVRNGELASIGSFSRQPITLTLDEYGDSRVVQNPSNASVSNSIVNMVSNHSGSTIAKIVYKFSEAYSTEQGLLSLGIDYKWASASISPSMSINSNKIVNSIYVYFLQSYYTVSINPPSSPASFFSGDINVDELATKVYDGNPLCYLSSVTYGRMLIAKISSTSTTSEIKTALNASLGNLSGKLEYSENEILKTSTYDVFVLGGNAEDAMSAATEGMSGIVKYINNGANFSKTSLGTPISYVVKYASDNTVVKLGSSLEYTVKDNCNFDPSAVQKFLISISNFEIIKDCDDGVFDNTGPGEFTYQIDIKDNGQIIRSYNSSSIATLNDGEDITINSTPYQFEVSKSNNHVLSISGSLSEWDSNFENKLSWPEITYNYPWSTIHDTTINQTVFMDLGSTCQARFNFNISKTYKKKK